MKATGYIELVIIVAALVMGLPLFLLCNRMANLDTNTVYMNDKSTWDITADITYEMQGGVLVPVGAMEPITISPAQAATLTYVQDEYVPNSARKIEFNYNATTLTDNSVSEIYDSNDIAGEHYTDVEPCWNGLREFLFESEPNSRVSWDSTHEVYKRICFDKDGNNKVPSLYGKRLYFVYNYERDSWMATTKYINIYY